ncbi:MAG: response regulator [Desulfobacter sp.]|nr:response regulator [Desulfobacter sp.]
MRQLILIVLALLGFSTLVAIDSYQTMSWQSKVCSELASQIQLSKIHLESAISHRFNAVKSLASLFILDPNTDTQAFSLFASNLLDFHPSIRAVQYADSNTQVTYVYPPEGNKITIDRPITLITDPERGPLTKKAIQEKRAVLQGPFELRQGGKGIVFRFPIFKDDLFLGLSIGVYDLKAIVDEAMQGMTPDRFIFSLKNSDGNVFWRSGKLLKEVQQERIRVADTLWTLSGSLKKRQAPPLFPRLIIWVFGSGFILVSLFFLWSSWRQEQGLEAVARKKTKDLFKADNALIASEEKYRLAMEATSDGLWDWNIQTGRVFFSQNWAKILSEKSVELVYESWVSKIHPHDKDEVIASLKNHLEGRTDTWQKEHRLLTKNGEYKWVLGRGRVVEKDSDNAPQRVVGTMTDISASKQAQAEQEILRDRLAQAQKMESIGRLAGGGAHDFNNMLTIILGNTEMVMEDLASSHPASLSLAEIKKAGERSAELTRQLLAFARKQTITPRMLNINGAVEGILKMFGRLIGEGIDLSWHPGKDLWPVKIDPSQLDQILANLCVNARDSMANTGKVTIETGTVHFDEAYCRDHPGFIPGDFVCLAVSDNGSGMDQGTIENLFEPFFTTKKMGEGTGLGLSTVYGIVKQNSGFINVYSELKVGSVFKVYLPRQAEKSKVEIVAGSEEIVLIGHETILLVEDEKAILQMTANMLRRLDYTVFAASTPAEALGISSDFETGDLDLLITDVVMPEMNGRDLAEKISRLHPNFRCLFMSGYTANVIAQHGILDQGLNFINKPFSMQALSAKIREVMSEVFNE